VRFGTVRAGESFFSAAESLDAFWLFVRYTAFFACFFCFNSAALRDMHCELPLPTEIVRIECAPSESAALKPLTLAELPFDAAVLINTAALSNTALSNTGSFETDDEYYVLADNRNSSVDSRLWGPVKKENIKAVALLEYFPFRKLRLFR